MHTTPPPRPQPVHSTSFTSLSASPASSYTSPLRPEITSNAALASHYRQYIRVLNARSFDVIGRFVARRVTHNGHRLSVPEYVELIRAGAVFCADEVVADVQQRVVAAKLRIEYPADHRSKSPSKDGAASKKVVRLNEMVFYHFDKDWHIESVASMIEEVE